MFLNVKEFVGKEIALVLDPAWWDKKPNLCRQGRDFDPAQQTISLETLVAADDKGIWIQRTGDEHVLNAIRAPEALNYETLQLTVNILVPWEYIVHVGLVVEGNFRHTEGADTVSEGWPKTSGPSVKTRGVTTGYGMDD